MKQTIRIKFIRILPVFLFFSILIFYLLWLKVIHIKELTFQFTPTILIVSASIIVIILLVSSLFLVKDKTHKNIFLLCLNFISVLLVILLVYVLPITGFIKYSYNKVVAELNLKNCQRVGCDVPANRAFPIDEDGSVNTKQLQNYYGSAYTGWIQGERMNDKDGNTIKVLIVYNRVSYNPLKTITIFKLSDSFDTLKMTTLQGYNRYSYPIEDILKDPSS